jgi:glycosyltransferase involved in cell wall biosynthesis
MKIAIVAPTPIPSRRANTIQVMKMAQALALNGHTVHLAAPVSHPTASSINQVISFPSWDELAKHYGLQREFPLEWIPARAGWRGYDYGLNSFRWARRQGADLLFTRLPQAAAIASQMNMPTILEVHDLPQGTLGPWLFRRFLRGRGSRRLVAITSALAEDLSTQFNAPPEEDNAEGHFQRKAFTIVLPDGVDLARYTSLPTPQAARRSLQPLLPDRFTAGYTGHFYTGRGMEIIFSLASRLPEITFLLAGGEPDEAARLRDQAGALNLPNLVITGFIPNAELPTYQAACDILLMPYQPHVSASSGGDISRYLSPMKVFEYMACKRAILSSDLPVLREVLNPRNSVLLHPQDLDSWTNAINTLLAQPAQRQNLAEQAWLDAKKYSWESRAQRILEGI